MRTYPIPRPTPDHPNKITSALLHDTRAVLLRHGLPDPRHLDLLSLQAALEAFVYGLWPPFAQDPPTGRTALLDRLDQAVVKTTVVHPPGCDRQVRGELYGPDDDLEPLVSLTPDIWPRLVEQILAQVLETERAQPQ